jgi:single-strand DNA-binding protein
MNRIFLVGRLTKDPETKVFEDTGKTVTRFTLAVDRIYKNNSGKKETDFIPIILWGKRAEIVSMYMKKGRLISLSGRLQTRNYDDSEGKRKYVAEVVTDEFQFIDSKKAEEDIG